MASTIASIISKIQTLLNDDGTIFTTATVTAAVRQALLAYNQRAPIWKTDTVTAVADQYEYDVSSITDIQTIVALYDSNNEFMPFSRYFEDGDTHKIRLNEPVSQDFTIIYSAFHTIDGLDSESTTTLLAKHEDCLCNLAAGVCVVIRANGKIETVNLNADVPAQWLDMWEYWKTLFEAELISIQRSERMPVQKLLNGWNDDYHGWE